MCRGTHINLHIFHWIIRIYEIKIILKFCKRRCNLTNKIKEITLNCVFISVSASRSRSWDFQGPPT
jgi:hypothetical protein